MPRGAARENHYLLDVSKGVIGDTQLSQNDGAVFFGNPAQHGLLDRARLLKDLFEHEVPVASLFCPYGVPLYPLGGFRHWVSCKVGVFDCLAREHRHLLVAEEDDIAGVAKHCRDVRRDQQLFVADTEHDWWSVANSHNLVGVIGRDKYQSEEASQLGERPSHGVLQPVISHLTLDEMGDNLGIGLGFETVAFRLELVFEFEEVLDDAVVHDDDLPGAVTMGMRVLFCRSTMSRPTRMPYTV